MGTIKRQIEIDDEDILNLKNALDVLFNVAKQTTSLDLLEIFTIQSIIKKWELVEETENERY